MSKYITEILEDINENPKNIEKYKDKTVLRFIFEHAFDPSKKFILPSGTPPFKKDSAPIGMSPANFFQEVKRFYVFCREDLKPIRRETLFIQLLENLHPSEAELVLAIKDQTLTKLYKNITHKLVYEAGFVAVEPPKEAPKKVAAKKVVTKKSQAPVENGATPSEEQSEQEESLVELESSSENETKVD